MVRRRRVARRRKHRRGRGLFDTFKKIASTAWNNREHIINAGKTGLDLFNKLKGGRLRRRRHRRGGSIMVGRR